MGIWLCTDSMAHPSYAESESLRLMHRDLIWKVLMFETTVLGTEQEF